MTHYSDALEYIHSFINYEKTTTWEYPEAMKLDRMKALCKEFGNPQNAFENIIIAGSKGKGSTAAILSSILRMDNYRVGLYTSPHLNDIRERIQVNGLLISETRFVEFAAQLEKTLNDPGWRKNPPTFFEVLTAMAFWHFREMKVHVAVLEVGLGGLYDSTNIALAKVVGIAPISLEHTDKLGKTVAKIAVQKCGIIKGREIVVSAPQSAEADAVIQKTAGEKEAEVLRVGKDIKVFERNHTTEEQRFDIKAPFGNYFDLSLKLLGRHQLDNVAVAVGLAKSLEKKTRLKISDAAVRQGVLDTRWPARLEKLRENPFVIFDGAHNPESVSKALSALRRHFEFDKLVVLLGLSADKDADGILEAMVFENPKLFLTQTSNPRALDVRVLSEKAQNHGMETVAEIDAAKAFDQALSQTGPQDLLLVTGSLFLLAELRKQYV